MLVSICALASVDHLPETKYYVPKVDTGFNQYNTPSLHFKSEYVLTFDDGPHAQYTPKILDILKQYNAKATFFILTSRITKAHMPIIKRIIDEGHILASHSHVHDNNNDLSRNQFKQKLKKSLLEIKKIYDDLGYEMKTFYFRFPYAAYGENKNYHHMNVIQEVSQELFNDNCIHFVFWDIDSGDWIPGLTSKQVSDNILSFHNGGKFTTYVLRRINGSKRIVPVQKEQTTITKGGVILQHDIQKRSIQATINFLEYAKKNKFKIQPLTEVDEFSYKNLNCKFINN